MLGSRPIAGRDYPRTLREFNAWFLDDAACREYVAMLRWPDSFVCPDCANEGGWLLGDGRYRCTSCRKKTSPTAGTIFAETKLPLRTWFHVAWYVTNQKQGVSALGLQRALGLGSYETAWSILHKLRRAMVRPDRDLLVGEIEVDETYVGGPVPGSRGRGALGKVIVAVAVEKLPTGKSGRPASGRVRLARIPDVTQETLTEFVEDTCAPGSIVHTDHWVGYDGLGVPPLPWTGFD